MYNNDYMWFAMRCLVVGLGVVLLAICFAAGWYIAHSVGAM